MAFLFFILVVSILLFIKQILRPRNYPPGPQFWPLVGNAYQVKKLSIKLGGQYLAFEHLAKKYKTNILGLKLGGELCIVVNNFKHVRDVLLSDDYIGRPNDFFIKLRCLGAKSGITSLDGPIWHEQRKFVEKHLKQIGFGKKLMEDMIRDEANSILELLKHNEDPIRFGSFIAPSVLNVIWSLSTGQNWSRDDPRFSELLILLNKRSLAFNMAGGLLNSLPWLRFIIPERIGYNLIVELNSKLKDFFQETINEHYVSWFEDRRDDLIYSFISEMNTTNKKQYTEHQLLAILLDLFFGGAITTSSTIDFIFLNLVMYPDIQEKAAHVLLNLDTDIKYSDRIKVPYIEAIIRETERLHGVVAITAPKRVLKNTVLDGYDIKKDTTIYINFHSVNSDEEYWGDPYVFRPERFINAEGKFINDEHVITFGLGRRRCLGELLARQCIFIFVCSILRKYRICKMGNEELSDKPVPGITLTPRPYQAKLIPR